MEHEVLIECTEYDSDPLLYAATVRYVVVCWNKFSSICHPFIYRGPMSSTVLATPCVFHQ